MTREDKVYYEAILSLTSSKEWEAWTAELEKEIYQEQADVLDSVENWGDVKEKQGYVKGLTRAVNLRADTLAILETADVPDSI